MIQSAAIITAVDGSSILSGTLLVEGNPSLDECEYPDDFGCFMTVPFRPRVLTEQQTDQLFQMVHAIPPKPHDCCYHAVDPCVIVELTSGAERIDDFCYGFAPACYSVTDNYRAAILHVLEFLSELAAQP